jgi:predicted  nucleic acid-binding Zn-ribbon protein
MAVIGDILVKFVADFAEFAEGMQQSQSRLEDFGKQIEKSSGSIEKMFSQLRTLAILSAAALAVKQVVDWTMATAAAAAEQEKLAKQLGYTTDEVQALQKIAKDTGNTFDATQRYYRTHRSELEALTKQFRDTGQLMSGDSVKAFADISREMDKFAETLGRVRQQMQGGSVNTALSVISKMIKDAGESLAFFDVYKGTITSVRELMAIFTGAGGLVGFTAQERALQHVTELAATAAQKEIEYQKAQLDSAQKIEDATRRRADAIGKQRDAILQGGGAGGTATVNSQVQAAQAAADQARAARDNAVAERDEAQKR